MYNYLYQITNLVNNKIYVGVHKTEDLDDGYMGSGKIIKAAIEKYGLENFRKDILEFFDTYDGALERETEIVTDEFLLREDVYNLRRGGSGGFDYINRFGLSVRNITKDNVRDRSKLANQKLKKMRKDNPLWWISRNEKVSNSLKGRPGTFTGKTHSEETKLKMSGKRPGSCNEGNSQYNTCWIIKDRINKKIKKQELDSYISNGWSKGRKIK